MDERLVCEEASLEPSAEDGEKSGKHLNFGTRDFGQTGEAVLDLRTELGVARVVGAGCAHCDARDVARRYAAYGCARSFCIGRKCGRLNEAEVDDVSLLQRVVAVAKRVNEIGVCDQRKLAACVAMLADAVVEMLCAALPPGVVRSS